MRFAQFRTQRIAELVDLATDMPIQRRKDYLAVEPVNQTVEYAPDRWRRRRLSARSIPTGHEPTMKRKVIVASSGSATY